MGSARWNPDDWDDYVASTASVSAASLFSKKMHKDLDPKSIKFRESCDSDYNPLSTPIIVAVDDTGSMGFLAENLIRKGLGVLIEEIYMRKPVTDPHVMCMAVGDADWDSAPLQVTQFEADMRLVDQLTKFYIESGGGGNAYESYNLPWYFAATHTKCDSMLKRNKKGYLFTVGDEPPPPDLKSKHVEKIFGTKLERTLTSAELFRMASKDWEIFHIIVEEGSYCLGNVAEVKSKWRKIIGQRAICLSNYNDLAELIVSTIQMNEGAALEAVTSTWKTSTALTVCKALKGLVPATAGAGAATKTGVRRL